MTKRALITRISSMGDIIFHLPLASILKENGYEITWVVGEKGYNILKNNPLVDEVIFVEFRKWKKYNIIKIFAEYLKIIRNLRAKNFDLAIETQGMLKGWIFVILSKAKRKIAKKKVREFSNLFIKEQIEFKTQHSVKKALEFAEYLGFSTENYKVALPQSDKTTQLQIKSLLQNIDKTKPVIGISSTTTRTAKHWSKENWKELVSKLSDSYNLVFTGTASDKEIVDEICNGKGINLAGQTNLVELIEVYRNIDLLISLDNGSTQIAWALQKPKIVSIFCQTQIKNYAPLGDENKYIALDSKIHCTNCNNIYCKFYKKDRPCVNGPTVDEVFCTVEKLVKPT